MEHFDNFDDFDRHFNKGGDAPMAEDEMTDDFSAPLADLSPEQPPESQKRPKFRRAASRSDTSGAAPEMPSQPVEAQPEPIQVTADPVAEHTDFAVTAEEIWAAAAEKVASSSQPLPQTQTAPSTELDFAPSAETPTASEPQPESQPEPLSRPVEPAAPDEGKAHTHSVRATAAQLLQAYIDCPSKLIKSGADVNEINQRYLAGLKYGAEWGFSTVIIPVSQTLANYLYQAGNGQPLSIDKLRERRNTMLLEQNDVTGEAIIRSSYEQKINYMESRNIDVENCVKARVLGKGINCFSSFVSQGKTVCDIIMAQIPTTNPWEVFIWLPIGGVNGAPTDTELAAISKTWYDVCGALPAVLDYGAVEYFVPHGRPSPEEALELAKSHFAVCPERVLRFTKSHCLGELADTLTKSCVWYLGWK